MKIKAPLKARIRHSNETELKPWQLPNVEVELSEQEQQKTNVLGAKSTWKYEPPEADDEEPIKPLTAEEIEQIRQQAYEEGFNQGKEEGFAKGYEEGKAQGLEQGTQQGIAEGTEQGLQAGKQQIEELAAQWQTMITNLHQPLAVVDTNVEQQLLQLASLLASAIVKEQITTRDELLIDALQAAIKALPSSNSDIQILLNPADIKRVEAAFGKEVIAENQWRLMPSPELKAGDIVVENSTSQIDLRLETRIKQVIEPYLQHAMP